MLESIDYHSSGERRQMFERELILIFDMLLNLLKPVLCLLLILRQNVRYGDRYGVSPYNRQQLDIHLLTKKIMTYLRLDEIFLL